MAPWLRILDTVLGLTDMALGRARGRDASAAQTDALSAGARGMAGFLEARLAGVVVAALKEAFARDERRLDFEREQMEAERQRAERALRLELQRQAGEREIGRLRLMAGVAVASWLGTLFFATRLVGGPPAARGSLGTGWLLILGALAASFAGQSRVAAGLASSPDRNSEGVPSSGAFGLLTPWLIVAGLAAIAIGILMG